MPRAAAECGHLLRREGSVRGRFWSGSMSDRREKNLRRVLTLMAASSR